MKTSQKISLWLFFCAGAVFVMALVGAITRLTESGLSIVEWKPVAGALPPLDAAAWEEEFTLYKQSPQYLKVNAGMTLAEFKGIYFWEWFHRLWGRLIGLFYALPLLFFWRSLPRPTRPDFIGVLALGFMQGAMGWYMVKSGLVDEPAVSQYRLAAHLMLAFLIYAALFRLGLSFCVQPAQDAAKLSPLRKTVKGTLALAALTMVWGAFTAGLDAGLVYNTFPLMNGYVVPPELAQHNPWWMAFVEDPPSVQFTHRVLAILTVFKVIYLFTKAQYFHLPPKIKRLFAGALIVALLQAGLGIATLLTQVNIHLATAHQAGALTLLTLLVWLLHEIPDIKKDKK